MNHYPPLTWGARSRLEHFKRIAADPKRNWVLPMTWRDVRFYKLDSGTGLDRGLNDGEPIWYSHRQEFRKEVDAHEILRMGHTGWYTDTDGNSLAIGIVVKFPHNRYIAGYRWTDNGERVYFPEIYDSDEEAAQAADGHAESFAEKARDADEKYREASRLDDEIETKENRLKELLAMRHNKKFIYVRDEIEEVIGDIRELRNTLKTEYAGVL